MEQLPWWLSAIRRYRWVVPATLLLYLALIPSVNSAEQVGVILILFVLGVAFVWEMTAGLAAVGLAVLAHYLALIWLGLAPAAGELVEQGVSLGVVAVVVGYLARRERELARRTAALALSQRRLAAIHEIASAVGSTLDFHDALRVCHKLCKELFGIEYLCIMWRDPSSGDLVLEWAEGFLMPEGAALKRGQGISGWVAEHDTPVVVGNVHSDPRYVPGLPGCNSQASVPMRLQGQVVGVLTVESTRPDAFSDEDLQLLTSIAEHLAAALSNARLHQQVRELAITDAATNLYNHRHFQDVLRAAAAERGDAPMALILLDLDHFKRVNDTHGHPAGDAVLKQVAELLSSGCRKGDILCRYGGEEFAVILPGASRELAASVAERMRERVQASRILLPDGTRLSWPVTISAGISVCPDDADSPVDLLVQADRALYAAKTMGRNRIGFPPNDASSAMAASH